MPGTTRDSITFQWSAMDVSMCSLTPQAYVTRQNHRCCREILGNQNVAGLEDANVVMLVIDAREGISDQISPCWALFSIVGAHLSLW